MTCAHCPETEELRECAECEEVFCPDCLEGGHCEECRKKLAHEAFLDAADAATKNRRYRSRMRINAGVVIR